MSSRHQEYQFPVENLNESNRDGIKFGIYSDETPPAYYFFKASARKTYTRQGTGYSPYGWLCYTNYEVRMIVDLYKYMVRFEIDGYDFDESHLLPQDIRIGYTPTVQLI